MPAPTATILIPYALTDLQVQALYVWLETVCSEVEQRRPFARRNQRHHDYVRDQRELLLLRLELWMEELPAGLLKDEIAALHATIREARHDYWKVGIRDGQQLGTVPITTAIRPIGVDVQAVTPLFWQMDEAQPQELASLVQVLGCLPQHRIELAAFLEREEDTLLVTYMAAELAEEYDAFVRLRLRPHFYTRRAAEEWTLDDSRELAASIAGTAHEILYANHAGQPQAYHLVDGEFLRNWAQHPRFHLDSL